ncbi:hypothetical protein CBR_g39242 [Chara braunii]|uniref:Uncharacterized protein n=1 Tax=Chara braunii TaxID=69332 RepID=A0A388LRD2_CHABU|nr:hypothetical protein CBR_g39242 [Chara braunii]|eukprot:GBG84867.1 hypothetical protein CBR_g39242 [Chara braunii]
MGDAMKVLENRTIDSKQEMDIVAALDEMKSMREREIAKIDDELVRQAFSKPSDPALRIILDEDEDGDAGDEELLKRGGSYDSAASQSKRSKALTGSDPSSGSFARPTDMLLSGSSASIAGSLHGGPPWQLSIGGPKLSPAPFLIKPKQPTKTAASTDNGERGGREDGHVGSPAKGERDGGKSVPRLGKPAEIQLGSSGNDVVMSTTVSHALDPKDSGVSGAGLASLMASYQGGSDSEDELDDEQ